MKSLNTVRFIANASKDVNNYFDHIRNAENYDMAKKAAGRLLGYLDCLTTFNNTMICMENNGFTSDFDELIVDWHANVYGALADKAINTEQDRDLIEKLLKERDVINESR